MNFVPFDDKLVKPNDPPWLTKSIKSFYNKYKKKYRNYIKHGRNVNDCKRINEMREEYSNLIKVSKEMYLTSLGAKLSNPDTGMKAYWTALKKLLNKVPIIPPISHND